MKKILDLLKKSFSVLKKIGWIILIVLSIIIGFNIRKKIEKHQLKKDIQRLKQEKQRKQEELEKELEKLKKEADEIEKTDHFNNSDDAVDFLNDVLRRIQDNKKK